MWLRFTDAGIAMGPDAPRRHQLVFEQWAAAVGGVDSSSAIGWDAAIGWLGRARTPDELALAQEVRGVLRLPKTGRLSCHVDNRGELGRDLTLKLTLRDPRGQVVVLERPEQAWYVDSRGRTCLVPDNVWALHQACRAAAPSGRDRDAQLRWWADIRALATATGATLSRYLEREQVVVADSVQVVLEPDGDDIAVGMALPGVSRTETEELLRSWGPAQQSRTVQTLRRGAERQRILTPPATREAITQVASRRRFTGAEAARVAQNPEAEFASSAFDLSAYSDRVIAIGPPRYVGNVVVRGGDAPRWEGPGTGEVVLQLQKAGDDTVVEIDITDAERRDEVRRVVHDALDAAQDFADVEGHLVRVDPQLATRLGDVQSHREDVERAIARPEELEGKVLVIQENVDELEHGTVFDTLDGVPGDFVPTLPAGLAPDVVLRDYQRAGVTKMSWWLSGAPGGVTGGLLADDMGLGKTLQVLVTLAVLAERGELRPSLVVAPVSLLENWRREAARFVGASIPDVVLANEIPRGHEAICRNADLVLVSYDTLKRRDLEMGRIDWKVVVCDEAQAIKNPTTRRAHAVKAMKSRYRIAMTGTPVENSLDELWSISDFFQPGLLRSLKAFRQDFASKAVLGDEARREAAAATLTNDLAPVVLRRMKSDVAKDLPALHVHRHPVPMSPSQRELYEVLKLDWGKNALGTLQKLLNCCAHPDLLSRHPCGEQVPKLEHTLQILDDVAQKGEKALLFVNRLPLQAMLQAWLEERFGIHAPILNGNVAARLRQPIVDRFSAQPGFGVLILSARACGTGLNITCANHVIHYTREWNPAVEAQATDRAYRIGQTRDVHVHLPIVTSPDFDTVEVTLDALLEEKDALRADFIRPSRRLSIGLEDFVRAGAEAAAGPGASSRVFKALSDLDVAEGLARRDGGEAREVPGGAVVERPDGNVFIVSEPSVFAKERHPPGEVRLRKAASGTRFYGDHRKLRALGDVHAPSSFEARMAADAVEPTDCVISSPVAVDRLDEAWEACLEFLDERLEPTLRALATVGVPVPEVGASMMVDGRVVNEAELCWAAQKVGVVVRTLSSGERGKLEDAGWTLFPPDVAVQRLHEVLV